MFSKKKKKKGDSDVVAEDTPLYYDEDGRYYHYDEERDEYYYYDEEGQATTHRNDNRGDSVPRPGGRPSRPGPASSKKRPSKPPSRRPPTTVTLSSGEEDDGDSEPDLEDRTRRNRRRVADDDDDSENRGRTRRRRAADDESDEDPHFRKKLREKKSSLIESGSSRSLRSKGDAADLPLPGRVSAGKVMSRKRAVPSSGNVPSPESDPPELVCLDSDDEQDEIPRKRKALVSRTDVGKRKFRSAASKGERTSLSTSSKPTKTFASTSTTTTQTLASTSSIDVPTAKTMEIVLDSDDEEKGSPKKKVSPNKAKRRRFVRDRSLLMPVHRYYYGWAKGEAPPASNRMFRFRCSHPGCSHVSYDNVNTMRHCISHVNLVVAALDGDVFSEVIRCPTCFDPFKTRYEMQCHYDEKHTQPATKSKGPHRCKICERISDGQEKFIQHMRRYHVRADMPYVCPICLYRSSVYGMVLDHFIADHANLQDAICPFCFKSFTMDVDEKNPNAGVTKAYMDHLSEHTVKRRQKCQQCRLIFLHGHQLAAHVQCDHKTAEGDIETLKATTAADHVRVTVSEATSNSDQGEEQSKVILANFVMTLGQRAGPQSLTAEGLKAWNLQCIECHRPFDFAGHFRTTGMKKIIQCDRCSFATTCSFAYAKHTIFFHGTAADQTKIVPVERPMDSSVRCRLENCGFSTPYGNRMARHLVNAHGGRSGAAFYVKENEEDVKTDFASSENRDAKTMKKTLESLAKEEEKPMVELSSSSEDEEETEYVPSTTDVESEKDVRRVVDDLLENVDPVGTVIGALLKRVEDVVDKRPKRIPGPKSRTRSSAEKRNEMVFESGPPSSPELISLDDSDEEDEFDEGTGTMMNDNDEEDDGDEVEDEVDDRIRDKIDEDIDDADVEDNDVIEEDSLVEENVNDDDQRNGNSSESVPFEIEIDDSDEEETTNDKGEGANVEKDEDGLEVEDDETMNLENENGGQDNVDRVATENTVNLEEDSSRQGEDALLAGEPCHKELTAEEEDELLADESSHVDDLIDGEVASFDVQDYVDDPSSRR